MTVFSYSGTELAALAGAHNYYRWVLRRFAPYLGRRIVEVGAGVGTFSRLLLDESRPSRLVLVEPADNLAPLLRSRFDGDPRVAVVHGYLEDVPPDVSADAIVGVNVLEHVADERAFLDAAARALTPDGFLLVLVPAGPWLFGALDEEFGHFRRYTRGTLEQALGISGFRLRAVRYHNFPGIVAWFLMGRVLRQRTLPPRAVARYDRFVVPWLSRLEDVWRPPFGQSLVAVASKVATKAERRPHRP
jgi:SAM-dependent methyltransferase